MNLDAVMPLMGNGKLHFRFFLLDLFNPQIPELDLATFGL